MDKIVFFYNMKQLNNDNETVSLSQREYYDLLNIFDINNYDLSTDTIVFSIVFKSSDFYSVIQIVKSKIDKSFRVFKNFVEENIDLKSLFLKDFQLDFIPEFFSNTFLTYEDYKKKVNQKYFLSVTTTDIDNKIRALEDDISSMELKENAKFTESELTKLIEYREILSKISTIDQKLAQIEKNNNEFLIESNGYQNLDFYKSKLEKLRSIVDTIDNSIFKQVKYLNYIKKVIDNLTEKKRVISKNINDLYNELKYNKISNVVQSLKNVKVSHKNNDVYITNSDSKTALLEQRAIFQIISLFLSALQLFIGIIIAYLSYNILPILISSVAIFLYNLLPVFLFKNILNNSFKDYNFVDNTNNNYKYINITNDPNQKQYLNVLRLVDKKNDDIFLSLALIKTYQEEIIKIREQTKSVIGGDSFMLYKTNFHICNYILNTATLRNKNDQNGVSGNSNQNNKNTYDKSALDKERNLLKIQKENLEFECLKIDIAYEKEINNKKTELKKLLLQRENLYLLGTRLFPVFFVADMSYEKSKIYNDAIAEIRSLYNNLIYTIYLV
ncbi:MAG: hypothetical protein NZZ41_05265 [Candidatus Dojkabacteria bacterium]|nr:hypothetical protein [Candidatus Dojkabacteria bacterium]